LFFAKLTLAIQSEHQPQFKVEMSQLKASLFSGVLSGIAGLLVFLGIHHLWIMPIWFILPLGLVIAAGGGLAVGWAYSELLTGLPGRPGTILAWTALVSLTLAPAVVLAQLSPPVFTTAGILNVNLQGAIIIFIRNLLFTATLTGGLVGWLIGRTTRALLATALAGFVFALGPGHNVPFLGNTPATGKGIFLLLAVILSASVVLVETQAVLVGSHLFANKFNRDLPEPNDQARLDGGESCSRKW
jgi:hypothetical protein